MGVEVKLKKGVDFRISEIADLKQPKHPNFRPKYVHLMPLAELISKVYDKGVTTKTVQNKWQKLIDNFQSEINVLINVSIDDIEKIDLNIAQAVESFRNNSIDVVPGGGGKYGEILFKPPEKKIITLDSF